MKKTLVIAGALLALTAGMASASGLNLYWNDCPPPLGTGVQTSAHLCTTNNGAHILVGSLVAPAGIDSMVAASSVIDVQTNQATLSPWWSVMPGGCRQGAMSTSYGFATLFSCIDPWNGAALAITEFAVDPNRPAANRFRIRTVAAVGAENKIVMNPGAEYYIVQVIVSRQKSVGTGSCAGCLDNGCFVYNSLLITQLYGTPAGDPTITNAEQSQIASLGPMDAGGCLATATRNATWGAIKAIYR